MKPLYEILLQENENRRNRDETVADKQEEALAIADAVDEFVESRAVKIVPTIKLMVARKLQYGILFRFNAHEKYGSLNGNKWTSKSGREWDTEYLISGRYVKFVKKYHPDRAQTVEEKLQQLVDNLQSHPDETMKGHDPVTNKKYMVSCLWLKNTNHSNLPNGIIISRNGIKYGHFDPNRKETHSTSVSNAVTDD